MNMLYWITPWCFFQIIKIFWDVLWNYCLWCIAYNKYYVIYYRTSIKNYPAIKLYYIVGSKMRYSSRKGTGREKKRNNRTWLNLQPSLSPQIVVIRTDDCATRPVAVIALYTLPPSLLATDGRQQLDIIVRTRTHTHI